MTCSSDDSLERVTELMRENLIRRVPVIDDAGQLIGIVALADVVERTKIRTSQTHETLKQISAPTEEPSKPRAQSRSAA